MKWFKIGDDKFLAKDISIQYNIDTTNNTFGYAKMIQGTRQSIDLTIVMENNQNNSSYFFNLYNQRGIGSSSNNYKFDINAYNFTANGCIIRSISTDPLLSTLTMDIICDYSTVIPLDERRNEIIDEILNNKENKNIN
jgi:hypothetical protein